MDCCVVAKMCCTHLDRAEEIRYPQAPRHRATYMPGGNLAVYDIEEIVKVRRETDRRHTCGLSTCMLLLCVGRASRMLVDPSRERERERYLPCHKQTGPLPLKR